MAYDLEELIPVVAMLAEKYTGFESTSITYEKAEQLMEAVLYCIRECEGENLPAAAGNPGAEAAYRRGLEIVVEKISRTREVYNEIMQDFCAYGNRNYQDTVTRGITGFFRFYDAVFSPQDTILTLDYPTLCPIQGKTGIDAIEEYVRLIYAEQRFLKKLPARYVQSVLCHWDPDYQRQFYNIAKEPLRDILAHMMLKKSMELPLNLEDWERLQRIVAELGKDAAEEQMTALLRHLVQEKFEDDTAIRFALCGDIKDFCTELLEGIVSARSRSDSLA